MHINMHTIYMHLDKIEIQYCESNTYVQFYIDKSFFTFFMSKLHICISKH